MGSIGHCKICQSPYAPVVNRLLLDEKNSSVIAAAVKPYGLTFTRNTLRFHKKHITHPLITAADAARRKPIIMPQSNQAVLEAIRDIGARRAIDHPEEVTIDHAIKASSILAQKETKGDNILVIMAKAVMQQPGDEVKGYLSGEEDEIVLDPSEYKDLGGSIDSNLSTTA